MPVLEFLLKFKSCSGIFANSGDYKGRQVLDESDMEVPPLWGTGNTNAHFNIFVICSPKQVS